MFANCQKGGTNMAGPDVCKTPVGSAVVPIPYPNIAAGATANPATAAKKVLISGMPAHNLRTTIPVSNGDNPGVVGGVMSGRVMGPCKHTMGVDSVLIGGSPATKMTNMTGQNGSNSNTKGATIAPAQTTVMLMKGGGGGGGGGGGSTKPPKTAAERAAEIHKAVPEGTQRRTTIAVTETAEGVRIISSSEKRLRPAQRKLLQPGEVEGIGLGHAEVTGVNAAKKMGLHPTGTAASRPICHGCQDFLKEQKVKPLSSLKK